MSGNKTIPRHIPCRYTRNASHQAVFSRNGHSPPIILKQRRRTGIFNRSAIFSHPKHDDPATTCPFAMDRPFLRMRLCVDQAAVRSPCIGNTRATLSGCSSRSGKGVGCHGGVGGRRKIRTCTGRRRGRRLEKGAARALMIGCFVITMTPLLGHSISEPSNSCQSPRPRLRGHFHRHPCSSCRA